MICLMINMHKCPFHIRQDFDPILELLADIVCFPKGSVCIHDDVNFHEIVGATL